MGLVGFSIGISISGSGCDVPHNSRSTIGSGDERGEGPSGVLHNVNGCCDGNWFAPMASIPLCTASDGDEEEDDKGVNGLGGGDGLQPASVDDDFGTTIASECELSPCRGMAWGLNDIDHQYRVE